jgi:hypothetical protein
VILDAAEALLDPVSDIEGFLLACLVDASTGMVLASRNDQDDISLPTAADIANVLSQLTGALPVDGLEDVMVTFRRQLYVIRLVSPEPQILLLVILDRDRVNLAMARREIRTFCASFAASRTTCRSEDSGRRTSLSGPAVTLTVPLTSGWRNRPGCIRAH